MAPSASAIDRAGDLLRDHQAGASRATPTGLRHAYDTVDEFRKGWAGGVLTTVNMGLRSMAATLTVRAEVTQRLKRTPRIIDKLVRHPRMRLSQMDDVGGCRVVLEDWLSLHQFLAHICVVWEGRVERMRDYLNFPKPCGYRAIHVVVMARGRRVEVQLRTRVQQEWAAAVEALEASTGHRLRDGEGVPSVLSALRDLSEAGRCLDTGDPLPRGLANRLRGLADKAKGQV